MLQVCISSSLHQFLQSKKADKKIKLDLAEGVRNTTTVFDAEGLDRVRLTRFIGLEGIVRPYSQREALGQFWLKTVDDGAYFKEDYIAHLELPGRDMLVMLTYGRIMLVRTRKLQTEWDIRLIDIQIISKERTGMSITLKGGANGPFIPVQDETSRNWLYKQIAIGKFSLSFCGLFCFFFFFFFFLRSNGS